LRVEINRRGQVRPGSSRVVGFRIEVKEVKKAKAVKNGNRGLLINVYEKQI
jgi:hypothetical protein